MDNKEAMETVLKSINDSTHKLEQFNVTLDADIVALKDRIDEFFEGISKLGESVSGKDEKEVAETISNLQAETEKITAARKQLEVMEKQLADNKKQLEEEKHLADRISRVFKTREEIYASTQKTLDDYEQVKDSKYGGIALKSKVESANQKRDIVDQSVQRALEKAEEMGHIQLPEKERDEKEDLRLAQKILDNRISTGIATEKDLGIYKNVTGSLKEMGAPEDIKVEGPEVTADTAVVSNPADSAADGEITTDIEVVNEGDVNEPFNKIKFIEKRDGYSDAELQHVRDSLGLPADAEVTPEQIDQCKADMIMQPEGRRKVSVITTAKENLRNLIDNAGQKKIAIAAAVGVAVVAAIVLNPTLGAIAVAGLAGAGINEFNKGRKL